MSLIDPVERARLKQESYRGSSAALALTLVFGVCAVLTTASIGLGIGGIVDQMRIMQLNSVFSDWDAGSPVWVSAVALPAGIVTTLVAVALYTKWNHRYTGVTSRYAILGPATVVLIGLMVGTWVSTISWAQPDAVGTAIDPTFGEDEAWGVGAWILYAAQWWLPGLFALLVILSLAGRFASKRGAATREAKVAELLRTGTRTEAEVVDSPAVSLESSRVAVTITLRFEDRYGASRWVKCPVLIRPSDVPVTGVRLPLVYDSQDPANVSRIFASISGGAAPADFAPVKPA